MVLAMERRRDQQALHGRFQAAGKIEVSMLEQVGNAKDQLEHQHTLRGNAECQSAQETNG